MILFNGRIYTKQSQFKHSTAVKIHGSRFISVGSDHEILSQAGPQEETIDLKGQSVLPGLSDAHIHLELYAFFLQQIDCETDSLAECLVRVGQQASQNKPGEWIRGHGWNHNIWPEGYGRALDLDQVAGDFPVFLTAKSCHAGWANTAALSLAGITASTPDPEGGLIVRNPRGDPTGILLERAMNLIERSIPAPMIETAADAILKAQTNLWKLGLTGVHDYDGTRCFSALQLLDENHQLHLRVNKGIPVDSLEYAVALGLRTGFGSDMLQVGSIKLFSDGALGSQTAAMIQPYESTIDQLGMLLVDAEKVIEIGQKAVTNGLSLAIHAIGDRANHEILNAYTQIRKFENANHITPLRHRIEHVQCLSPHDITRLAQLNIIASMQPIHATSDMHIADAYWGNRSKNAYALHSLQLAGTQMAFGSDAPVESPNPFLGLHAAVTRRRTDGSPSSEGWYPDQRISLIQALNGYTTGAAYAANREDDLGQIVPGFFADLILLDFDPFSLPSQDLWKIKPSATMVGGQWVWQN
jgi:predicted amidohydrolase YtcJ